MFRYLMNSYDTDSTSLEGNMNIISTGKTCGLMLGARLALFQRGIRVPEDLSLVGFDDLPMCSYMTPPLTSVRQPVYEVGLYAAHTLLEMMGYPSEAVQIPPLELMVRQTTRALPTV